VLVPSSSRHRILLFGLYREDAELIFPARVIRVIHVSTAKARSDEKFPQSGLLLWRDPWSTSRAPAITKMAKTSRTFLIVRGRLQANEAPVCQLSAGTLAPPISV
jgi:hypothetical protein